MADYITAITYLHTGFGVAAQATEYCRDLDPTGVVVLHQADIGEYLRVEDDGLL
jgi:ribosome biogenesis protein Nip4